MLDTELYLFSFIFDYIILTHLLLIIFFFERWNISELDEIRFYGVAPHWYFRPLMGLLVISPTHYEGLMWMALFFVLLTFLPIIYNWYNVYNKHIPTIPMQNSLLQTFAFIIFMMSLFCSASMLPCGRYYYEPEGGYVGNPWVKFSYQYIYLYMAWFVHHLDIVDHYIFQFFQTFIRKSSKLYKKNLNIMKNTISKFVNFSNFSKSYHSLVFNNKNYDINLKKKK